MRKSFKSSNFLKVIDRYAKKQKTKITDTIQEMEEYEIKKAESEIMQDVNNMIQKEIINMKNKIAVEVSHKEMDERKQVSQRRLEIIKEIFEGSRKKLTSFTFSQEYSETIKSYAQKIASVLTSQDVQIFIKPADEKYTDLIQKAFGKACKILTTDDILIGGIRGYSPSHGLIVDETLDAKLDAQEDWVASNFGVLLV